MDGNEASSNLFPLGTPPLGGGWVGLLLHPTEEQDDDLCGEDTQEHT